MAITTKTAPHTHSPVDTVPSHMGGVGIQSLRHSDIRHTTETSQQTNYYTKSVDSLFMYGAPF